MPIIHPAAAHTHEMHGVRFTTIAAPSTGAREASVWRVDIPPTTDPVPHELTREELIVVLSGRARASLDGRVEEVGPGGAVVVPPDTPFSLAAAGSAPVIALAYLPVGGQGRLAGHEPFTPPWAE
jgi:quercetin dioxygenase-like cupin family protein